MAKEDTSVTLIAVGDVDAREPDEINRLPHSEKVTADEHFDLVRPILRTGDITFGQLELPLANPGLKQIGGGETLDEPGFNLDPRQGARVLANAGFDVMSVAGNHTMMYGEQGLFDTLDAVAHETDIKLVGAGRTIKDAREPIIVDRNGTRVGFLASCSVLRKDHWAVDEVSRNGTLVHRPGCVPLRAHSTCEQFDFQPGTAPVVFTRCYPEDLEVILEDIKGLREQVDVVVVSCHWGVHFEPGIIATYQVEAAHAAIDAGADLILGHHPHIIKGIDFYKNKPIIYGMPNLNLPTRSPDVAHGAPGETYDAQKSFITKITITDKAISRIALIPCHLENTRLTPEPLPRSDPRSEAVREYMEWVCRNNTPVKRGARRAFPAFDTKFTFEGDEILVEPRSGS